MLNLRRRLHAPAAGRGRIQQQLKKAFGFLGNVITSSEAYEWCALWPDDRRTQRQRYSVWRVLRLVADPVGRADTIGRPWIWRLKGKGG
jgi:hypothetical protein